MRATYPNYLTIVNGMTVSEYCRSLAAPGSPYADPTYFARIQPPLSLARDTIHPNDTLSQLIAQNLLVPFIEAKGWHK